MKDSPSTPLNVVTSWSAPVASHDGGDARPDGLTIDSQGLATIDMSAHLGAPMAWLNPANVGDRGYDRSREESLLAPCAASKVRTGMSISTVWCQMGRVLVDQAATDVSDEVWSSQRLVCALAMHRRDTTLPWRPLIVNGGSK